MKKKKKENIFKRIGSKFKIEDERFKKIIGFLFVFFSLYLLVVFISFLINGNIDQDKIGKLSDDISNFGGLFGNTLSHLFLRNYFGISSFIIPILFFNWGLSLVFYKELFSVKKGFSLGILAIVWISLFFGFFTSPSILSGVFGSEMNYFLDLRIGKIGTGFFIFLSLLTFIIIRFNPKFKFNKTSEDKQEITENNEIADEELSLSKEVDLNEEEQEQIIEPISQTVNQQSEDKKEEITPNIKQEGSNDLGIEVHVNEENTLSQKDIKIKLEELGDYDPKLDLSNYKISLSIKAMEEAIEKDVEAFGQVMAAYGLPKDSADERAIRTEKIQESLKDAINAPMECAMLTAKVIPLCKEIAKVGNVNIISDAGVAVLAARAAFKSAELNVYVNASALKDKAFADAKIEEIRNLSYQVDKEEQESFSFVANVTFFIMIAAFKWQLPVDEGTLPGTTTEPGGIWSRNLSSFRS